MPKDCTENEMMFKSFLTSYQRTVSNTHPIWYDVVASLLQPYFIVLKSQNIRPQIRSK